MHSEDQKTEPNLSAIIEGLIQADIRFILVGGLATVVQGAPVTTIEIEFRGHTVHVLDIEKIIELKETSNDPKDLQRLPLLKETLRQLQNDI